MPARASRLAHPQHRVSAVLVAHDGLRWLPETLAALAQQTRAPQVAVAVDVGSDDGTSDLLLQAVGEDRVVGVARNAPFATAVAAGVATLDALRAGRRGTPAGTIDWLWLVHDDFAPDPGALAALLDAAEAYPGAAVLGPKVRDWDDPRVLVEVGLTVDRAGRRETGLERREFDQGQHDAVRQVLAVGTAGCLIRRDVWDALGGLDTHLPIFRDEIDLGWRVAAAGLDVIVVPDAIGRHARATWTGRRPPASADGSPTGLDRRHSLIVLVANLPGRLLVTAVPRLVVGALVRTIAFLLTRQVHAARDELAALGWLARHLGVLRAMRAQRSAHRDEGWHAVRPLLEGRTARLRGYLEAISDWVTGGGRGGTLAGGLSDDTDPDAPDTPAGRGQFLRRRPALTLAIALVLVALVAERGLLGGGRLVGGELFPPPDGARDLWRAVGSAGTPGSLGTPAPVNAVLAVLATLLRGKAWLAVDVLVLGSVPLAGLLAYRASARLTESIPLRMWAGFGYALLPIATGAIAGGRLDTAVAFIAAPALLGSAHRLLATDPRQTGWRHAFACGLGLALATAFAPQLWLLAFVLVSGGALASVASSYAARRGAARRQAYAGGLALLTALVALVPWSLDLLAHPAALLEGTSRGAVPAPSALDLVLLRPGGPGLPWRWVTVALIVAALSVLLRRDRVGRGGTLWVVAGGSWAMALATVRGPGGLEPGYPGPALAVAAAALVAAAVLAADGARELLAARDFSWRQPVALGVAIVAGVTPAVAMVAWIARGAADPIDRRSTAALPPFLLAQAEREPGLRVLWLTSTEQADLVSYTVTGATGPRLDIPAPFTDERSSRMVRGLIRDLTSPRGTDAAEGLATFAVRFVAVPAPAPPTLAAALDAQAGLSRDPYLGAVQLWRTIAPAGRVTLLPPPLAAIARAERFPLRSDLRAAAPVVLAGGREAVRVTIPPGPGGRLLVLSEPAAGSWVATGPDGAPLDRVLAYGWAQGFTLPAGGGHVVVRRDLSSRHTAIGLELAILVVLGVLAAPSVRRPGDETLPNLDDELVDGELEGSLA